MKTIQAYSARVFERDGWADYQSLTKHEVARVTAAAMTIQITLRVTAAANLKVGTTCQNAVKGARVFTIVRVVA
jgi:hypothetical protein